MSSLTLSRREVSAFGAVFSESGYHREHRTSFVKYVPERIGPKRDTEDFRKIEPHCMVHNIKKILNYGFTEGT